MLKKLSCKICLKALLLGFLVGGCAHSPSSGPAENSTAADPVNLSVSARPVSTGKFRAVALSDLDNDGYQDLIAGGTHPTTLTISYGDGQGRLLSPEPLATRGDIQSLAVGDVNGDGYRDIVYAVQGAASGIQVHLNLSQRRWRQIDGPVNTNKYQGIRIADVNADSHPDIIAANATSQSNGGIQVWLGDGRGGWPVETGPASVGVYMDVTVADFNADGFLDLAGAGWGADGSIRTWLGDGNGSWSEVTARYPASYYGLRAADLNADGQTDLLAATHRGGVKVLLGNGTGLFEAQAPPVAKGSFWDVLDIDLDGDGRLDLVASSNDNKGIAAWRFDGANGWEVIADRFPFEGMYFELTAADLNSDGIEDVCAASYGEGIQFWQGRSEFLVGSITESVIRRGALLKKEADLVPEENSVYTTVYSGKPEYKIGAGDVLEITLWQGVSAEKEEVLVRPDGRISFGFVEDLPVDGLTVSRLDEQLTEVLKTYLKQPRLDVIVKAYNSKFVSLTGAIGSGIRTAAAGVGTGQYPLTGKVRLLEMVARAGGPTLNANLQAVQVRHKDGRTASIDLYRALYLGDFSQDIVLDDGDVVFIPTIVQSDKRIYVFGEVVDPGLYTFQESEIRLFDAISKAGGPTVFGDEQETRVVRGDPNRPEIIPIRLRDLIEHGDQTQNITLASGDLVYVPRNFWGKGNRWFERAIPLIQLIIGPARIINEYDRAIDVLE
jgi:protein involved in polysaccharide export with SLBB domain